MSLLFLLNWDMFPKMGGKDVEVGLNPVDAALKGAEGT
jgi:hypothetical protein